MIKWLFIKLSAIIIFPLYMLILLLQQVFYLPYKILTWMLIIFIQIIEALKQINDE